MSRGGPGCVTFCSGIEWRRYLRGMFIISSTIDTVETDCYVLPSVTSLRQDYAEFFRIEPADEYGRNDAPKLGFFLVDVHRARHVVQFVRTHGETATASSSRLNFTVKRPASSPIGVHLRHPWAEEIELPYNAPSDELSRKRVRNDYPVLALWDLGIKKSPGTHIRSYGTARIRSRMLDMHALGLRFTVFTYGLPDEVTLRVMSAHRSSSGPMGNGCSGASAGLGA